jgi:hypothetical protein
MRRRFQRLFLILAFAAAGLVAWAYATAISEPVVRTTRVAVPGWQPGTPPMRLVLLYGRRYACGLVREGGKTLVVTAGLGTSGIPLRLGAVPDMWLVELGA